MKGKYYESEHEKVVVELLQQTGWDYTHGSELHNRKLTELRRFFTTALPADSGTAVSPETIKAKIRAHIAAESPAKPLSDAKLESLLAADGTPIARRTIAKYREQLRILPAHLRRRG